MPTCNPITISNCPPTYTCDACKEIIKSSCISYGNTTVKETLDSLVDCCDGVIVYDLELTAEQILTLNSTPIEIVPAPGAGKYIRPLEAWGKIYSDPSVYVSSGDVRISFVDGATVAQFSNSFLTETDDSVYSATAYSGKLLINTGLEVSVSTEDPTQGKGTLHLYIKVAIETF